MKTFLEILDIKNTDLDLELRVRPIKQNGSPGCRIWINELCLFDGILEDAATITHSLHLLSPIKLELEMHSKIYDIHKETAVVIDYLRIDDIDIRNYTENLITYKNDQMAHNRSLYLGFNGTWTMIIPQPFYGWWHKTSGQGWLLMPSRTKSLD